MVNKREWLIKKGYLKNFEKRIQILNLEDNSINELTRDEINSLSILGFFCKNNDDIYGYYRVDDDLFLKTPSTTYNLSADNLTLEVVNANEDFRTFTIKSNDEVLEELTYERQPYTDYDVWSSEDDLDFFAWTVTQYIKMN